MRSRVLGVIGGSGIYEINGLQDAKWQTVDTPWGSPSDQILTGNINGVKMAVDFQPKRVITTEKKIANKEAMAPIPIETMFI